MSKELLKEKFSTGSKPTGEDFSTLIDEIFGKASEDQLDALNTAIGKVIASKADGTEVENLTELFNEFREDLTKYLTEEDLGQYLDEKADQEKVYTKDEVDNIVKEVKDSFEEEINAIKDDISSIREEISGSEIPDPEDSEEPTDPEPDPEVDEDAGED